MYLKYELLNLVFPSSSLKQCINSIYMYIIKLGIGIICHYFNIRARKIWSECVIILISGQVRFGLNLSFYCNFYFFDMCFESFCNNTFWYPGFFFVWHRTILYVSLLYAAGNLVMAITAVPPPEWFVDYYIQSISHHNICLPDLPEVSWPTDKKVFISWVKNTEKNPLFLQCIYNAHTKAQSNYQSKYL